MSNLTKNIFLNIKMNWWQLFAISFLFIPFLKVLTAAYGVYLPIYYFPLLLTATVALAKYRQKIDASFFIINALLFIYIGTCVSKETTITIENIKLHIASLTYINSFYLFILCLKEPENNDWFRNRYTSYVSGFGFFFLLLCFCSFLTNSILNPINTTTSDLINFLTFNRDTSDLRFQILYRLNPVGLILNNIYNIRYIGQQLLLLPFVGFIFLLLDGRARRSHKVVFFFLLLLCSFLVNSRGFLLCLFLTACLTYKKQFSGLLHKLFTFFISLFPFAIFFLNKTFSSGRYCQIEFARDHLSFFGNGIGTFINSLNSKCSYVVTGKTYNNIVTMAYDNIHLEFVHYFGVILYTVIYIIFLKKFLFINSFPARILTFFLFVFLALNFNLFEFLVLPVLIVLTIKLDLIKSKHSLRQ